ncbi:MAG: phytanoyl-CoA dioxygenase family protein [Planctomycetota bacterium]|nr:phytanoyl-CoA dioxygenase family protein [Planctomycetota bacterium]
MPEETTDGFHRDGFVRRLPLLEAEEVRRVRAAVDEIRLNLDSYADRLYEVEQAYTEKPGEVVCHFLGAWRLQEVIRELVFDPRVTKPLAQLLGVDRLRFWHDQVFYKPARHPGVVPWHQDYSYWQRTVPARHITLYIALDDVSLANGCVQYVPGSHQWGLLPAVPFDSSLDEIRAFLSDDQVSEFRPVAIELAAGEASVHHSHLLHGSDRNDSDASRCGLVLNYMAADTRSASDEPLLTNVPVVPSGSIVEGEHFPIVLG